MRPKKKQPGTTPRLPAHLPRRRAFVGYQIYLAANQVEKSARDRMAKKNVVFTKDGMRVGVKHVEQERYVDKTQSWVVKAWNLGTQIPSAVTKRK
ncbi:hypothetical protein G7054_g13747 [Neopestalotiopsis clavispora]|nr:hypothetical protein G7054_g13747 [Neopestalotiopsis clavispora]